MPLTENPFLNLNPKNLTRARFCFLFFTALMAAVLFFPVIGAAQGNLLVTPRRVVFEGNKRSVDLNLANIGQDTATYAISMVQIKMTVDGGFETITTPEPGQKFADQNLRYFPRSVTLAPNEAQVVKVQLFRGKQLPEGEYRSHIYFRAVPKIVPLGESEEIIDTTSITVRLTPVFGITIPAIIRVGESDTKVNLSDLKLDITDDGTPNLMLKFNRTGNFSVYGDLAVDHVSDQGVTTRVGAANGIAVYTPNTERRFRFALNNETGVDFASGKLKVVFSAPSDSKPVRYAEAELRLN